MKALERKLSELENSLNSFRESNTVKLVRLESVDTESIRRISELEAKFNTVNENAPLENRRVTFKFSVVLICLSNQLIYFFKNLKR
jgi:hypothetical protein